MKRLMAIALVAIGIVAGTTTAHASESGWAWRHHTWVHYSFRFDPPDNLLGRALAVMHAMKRDRAVSRAAASHQQFLRRMHQVKRQSEASIAIAQATIGFPASCVADAEEGGSNSTAGYFGMISPPSAYPDPGPAFARQYGDSWWSIPYVAQLQIAIAEYQAFGSSAWGPTTRAKCF